uniref:Uncharacterized protein ORF100_2 n=1 Tax=Nothoceros aenigmaticus TaxID=13813 RepID=C3RYM8_9EMBR|nr:hypothetical protein MeaeMp22 [Nothoceros aenigmaticus]ACC86784.1 hypothetical protein MeaeMp22 [Nothoceros aenigmaticus]
MTIRSNCIMNREKTRQKQQKGKEGGPWPPPHIYYFQFRGKKSWQVSEGRRWPRFPRGRSAPRTKLFKSKQKQNKNLDFFCFLPLVPHIFRKPTMQSKFDR